MRYKFTGKETMTFPTLGIELNPNEEFETENNTNSPYLEEVEIVEIKTNKKGEK